MLNKSERRLKMPNWCYVEYVVVGKKSQLDDLAGMLKNIDERKEQKMVSDFGKWWIGELVNDMGFDTKRYYTRGEIIHYEVFDDKIIIAQETAWCEQEDFRKAIEECFPDLKVWFYAEETGCCYYESNDSDSKYFRGMNRYTIFVD